MKLQILPNWCKKIGVSIFIIFSFISAGDDFIDGYNAGRNSYQPIKENIEHKQHTIKPFEDYFGKKVLHYFDVISLFGILIYMLSKEKIEDDYITKLRLESYQLTAITGLIFLILLYAFSKETKLSLDYFITLFMYFYLITFFIKKRIY